MSEQEEKQTSSNQLGLGPELIEAGEKLGLVADNFKKVEELKQLYPKSKSAVMPILYIVQQARGDLDRASIKWVADSLGLSMAHVLGVATFYTMYYKKPVGRYHVQVCRTLSCMLCGARKLTAYLKQRLELEAGEISKDGLWSFEEVECLGSCGTAPMVEINDVYFENLTPESLGQLMDEIESENPDLRYSETKGALGTGLPQHPRSRVAP